MPEPVPLSDAIKTAKAKWPRLLAKVETDSATPETREASPPILSQERGSERAQSETRQKQPETGAADTGTRVLKPLSERLVSLFGKGDNPTLRMTLYLRIQLTCQTFGKEADLVLRDVIDAAKTKRNPGNYFAFSIVRRFREAGFFGGELQ